LEKYEKEKCQKAAKELGKSPAGVQKRIKELGIGK
jgi:DNA-binding Lrp family transcriptional regulator